ncbi:MAG: ATPase, T2SS/T4P/T4SS family, partial [Bacteroidota bacterium]
MDYVIENGYITLDVQVQQLLTAEQAWHYRVVPKAMEEEQLVLFADESAMDDVLLEELEVLFGREVTIEHREAEVIQKTLGKYYRRRSNNGRAVEVGSNQADDFLANLIGEAKQLGSSDIHIEIYEEKARVRIRIDGMLVERYRLGKTDYPALINKIKIKAHLDIAEKRLPQDGR